MLVTLLGMPKNPNRILAERLRALRIEKGWSQEEFADLWGLHRTYVGAIERGERNVTLETLQKIAGAFGISSAELIREDRRAKASE